jgi:pyrrolidone-carboxylate peptidase
MNERIKELLKQASKLANTDDNKDIDRTFDMIVAEKFAELIVKECIDKIETHRIPVGNSAAGEMACEWTYAALKEIRDEIKEHFGVEQ